MNDLKTINETKTVDQVFNKFNDTIDCIELETYKKEGLPNKGFYPLSFSGTRTLKLVNEYDDFINDVKNHLKVYAIHKLENENFWRVMNLKNDFKVVNMSETYGKTSVYQIGYRGETIGFYLNDKTHDGQITYFMWNYKEKTFKNKVISNKNLINKLFLTNRKYPSEFGNNKKYLTRFGQITKKLSDNGKTAINAWEILDKKDNIFFYGELKKHNFLSKQDKKLLKEIRKTRKVISIDSLMESLEDRKEWLEERINEFYSFEPSEDKELLYPIRELAYHELELKDIKKSLNELKTREEDNSLDRETTLNDYF